jgi:hypothetical protein
VDTATTNWLGITRTQLDGYSVDALHELIICPQFDKFGKQYLPYDHYVVSNSHTSKI